MRADVRPSVCGWVGGWVRGCWFVRTSLNLFLCYVDDWAAATALFHVGRVQPEDLEISCSFRSVIDFKYRLDMTGHAYYDDDCCYLC